MPQLRGDSGIVKEPRVRTAFTAATKALSSNECFGETVANASTPTGAGASAAMSGNPPAHDRAGPPTAVQGAEPNVANRPPNGVPFGGAPSAWQPAKPVFSPVPPSGPGIKNPLTAPYEG